MKKLLQYITLSFLLISFGLTAQNNDGKRDKIIKAKIAYISAKINLSSEQADKFWPIYNEYDNKRHTLRKSLRKEMKQDISSYSESEARTYLNSLRSKKSRLMELENEYFKKFDAILTAKQHANLKKSEIEFRKKLEKRIKDQ